MDLGTSRLDLAYDGRRLWLVASLGVSDGRDGCMSRYGSFYHFTFSDMIEKLVAQMEVFVVGWLKDTPVDGC